MKKTDQKAKYQYDCTEPKNMPELEYVIEHMEDISLEEFSSNVDSQDFCRLQKQLGYSEQLTVDKDWHVRYAKSSLKGGQSVYVFIHSCIEYVFY